MSVDLDGTLADIMSRVNELRSEDLKNNNIKIIRKEDITAYDLKKTTPYKDISYEQINEYMKKAWMDPSNIKLEYNKIPEILKNLHNYYEIYIVTATIAEDDKIKEWLACNDIVYDKLIHLDKQCKKAEHIAQIHIDDCSELVSIIPSDKTLILLSQPWNKNNIGELLKEHKNVVYLENWKEVENYLIETYNFKRNNTKHRIY
ncbi:MAG: 5' nucleotidase, NT5C type [Candidatus Micrarchaeia archaeon]